MTPPGIGREKHTASLITTSLLRQYPLPGPDEDGDKEQRGRALVVGGSSEMPGAIILASVAALRAGAGKLRIATCRSAAQGVAISVPEARVFALPETKTGSIAHGAAEQVSIQAAKVGALLIGPGMADEPEAVDLIKRILPNIKSSAVVLDATALRGLDQNNRSLEALKGQVVLTPHSGEMARLLELEKTEVEKKREVSALRAARLFSAVVVLKGRETLIASPNGNLAINRAGNVGLATSGSGDVLAGLIAGLLARGAGSFRSAIWGVHLHALAGDALAKRMGKVGFLARELLEEVPGLMRSLG